MAEPQRYFAAVLAQSAYWPGVLPLAGLTSHDTNPDRCWYTPDVARPSGGARTVGGLGQPAGPTRLNVAESAGEWEAEKGWDLAPVMHGLLPLSGNAPCRARPDACGLCDQHDHLVELATSTTAPGPNLPLLTPGSTPTTLANICRCKLVKII